MNSCSSGSSAAKKQTKAKQFVATGGKMDKKAAFS